ncbi:hypothetical protein CH063_16131, partial [Colletotrichum higginsianum]
PLTSRQRLPLDNSSAMAPRMRRVCSGSWTRTTSSQSCCSTEGAAAGGTAPVRARARARFSLIVSTDVIFKYRWVSCKCHLKAVGFPLKIGHVTHSWAILGGPSMTAAFWVYINRAGFFPKDIRFFFKGGYDEIDLLCQ